MTWLPGNISILMTLSRLSRNTISQLAKTCDNCKLINLENTEGYTCYSHLKIKCGQLAASLNSATGSC